MTAKPPIVYNTKNLQVLTDTGFRPFVGIVKTNELINTIKFTFDDDSIIEVTKNHKFIISIKMMDSGIFEDISIHAQLLVIGDSISCMNGKLTITNIESGKQQSTYDLIEVGGNRYKTNQVISHNCEFLSSDPLLIDSLAFARMELDVTEHIREDLGWKFWQILQPQKTYLLGVDPATGSSEDFTTMQVYDFQDLSLVAEFRSNTMSSPVAYASLKLMLNKIDSIGSDCFFSIENNGVGEGLIALYENDEHIPDKCEFVSEEGANRLGMRTESRVKLRTCLTLKQLVESGKVKIRSSLLLKELRSFISTKGSYAAMIGATDDLISSLLIVIRLLDEMATYNQEAFDIVNDYQETGRFTSENEQDEYDNDYEPDGMIM